MYDEAVFSAVVKWLREGPSSAPKSNSNSAHFLLRKAIVMRHQETYCSDWTIIEAEQHFRLSKPYLEAAPGVTEQPWKLCILLIHIGGVEMRHLRYVRSLFGLARVPCHAYAPKRITCTRQR
jgi:hypothetical protein